MFIHKMVRLSADRTRVFRYFTVPKLMKTWLTNEAEVILKEKKYIIDLPDGINFELEDYKREKYIFFKDSKERIIEIYFMMCGPRTEYCTEIHLKYDGFDFLNDEYNINEKFWEEKLEGLRKIINKDWVILDEDVSNPYFKGSRL